MESVVSQFWVQKISSCIAMEALQKNYKARGIDLGFYHFRFFLQLNADSSFYKMFLEVRRVLF